MAKSAFPFTASSTGDDVHLTYSMETQTEAWNIPRAYIAQLSQLLAGCTSPSKMATSPGGGGRSPKKAAAGRKTAARK